jgi:nitrogen-specific signal transduction histidine kinase
MNRTADTPLLDGFGSDPLLTADIMRAVTAPAIVALDADGEIVYCNDTARRLHGRTSGPDTGTWPASDLYGSPFTGSGPVAPIGPLLHRLSAGGTWTGLVECRQASDDTVVAEMTVSRRRSTGDDARTGFVLVYQPDSPPAASQPAASQPAPGAALPGGPLLSLLGHELRSPLTAVIGLTRMLLRRLSIGPPDPESQARQLNLLLTSASQMLRLTEQVAEVARLDSGSARPAPAPIDIRDVVGAAVQGQQPAAAERQLRLLVDIPAGPFPLTCEENLITRLLRELIDNAVRYTDGTDVRIRVTAPDRDTIMIEVVNDGPAIPAEERSRIFGPFERGSSGTERDDGGTGLGLYLARQLARELGATLRLRDDTPLETSFAVEIPRGGPPAADRPAYGGS